MTRKACLSLWLLCVLAQRDVVAQPIPLLNGQSLGRVDFERHVHALLDRQGCNAGKCHGNRNGMGGLSLSLLAAQPAQDHATLTRLGGGRLLNTLHPDSSLTLLKATGAIKHGGGARVAVESWEHEVLRRWIAEGATHVPGSGRIERIEVVPGEPVLLPCASVQLKVLAHFADGTKEDVTCFSDFRLPPDETVRVSQTGLVQADGPGDAKVLVFYRGRMRAVRILVANPPDATVARPNVPETNFIDRAVFRRLRQLNIVPSELSSDEQFLRRAMIDVLGTAPAPEEIHAFKADPNPDKRTRKIDEMLAHPRHASRLATRLCELTEMTGEESENAGLPRTKAAQMTHDWFRKRLAENMPYDQILRAVVTATSKEGRDGQAWQEERRALEQTATGFGTSYAQRDTLDHFWRNSGQVRVTDPDFGHWRSMHARPTVEVDSIYLEVLGERIAAAFLGVRLECARCHDHPLEGWTTADHRAFAGLLGRVRLEKKPFKGTLSVWQQNAFAREVHVGEWTIPVVHPETGAALKPRVLGGPPIDAGDPRQTLADWLARPDNPFVARHFVNVVWQHYFGAALAGPADRLDGPLDSATASLLDLLARDFIAHRFNIRRLERTLLTSRVYQLSSSPNDSNKHDKTNFSHARPIRLSQRLAGDLMHAMLETREVFGPDVPAGRGLLETMHQGKTVPTVSRDAYREEIDEAVRLFGRSNLVSRCEPDPTSPSYLFYMGQTHITNLLAKSPRINRLADSKLPTRAIVEECFLAVLSRSPDAEHVKLATEHIERDPAQRRRGIEDIFWALLNTKEFQLRH